MGGAESGGQTGQSRRWGVSKRLLRRRLTRTQDTGGGRLRPLGPHMPKERSSHPDVSLPSPLPTSFPVGLAFFLSSELPIYCFVVSAGLEDTQ